MNDTLSQSSGQNRVASRPARKWNRSLLLTVVGSVLAALALVGFASRGERPTRTAPVAPIEVEAVVLDSSATGTLILPGRIKAREEVTLTSRAAGRVTRLLAQEGETVREGQVLAIFDAPESRRARTAAERELEAATLAHEVAHRQAARVESLFAADLAAPHDRELAASAGRDADARLEGARSTLESLEAALTLRAPFDAVVARRFLDTGADVPVGAPLMTLRSSGGTEIVVPVPEAALPALPSGRFEFQVGEGAWRPARLARLEGMTDANTRTRTARLFPVSGPAPEPGAFARVRLASPGLPDPPLPLLPLSSIVRRGALTGAYVIEDGRAVLRWLKLGREQGESVEVLSGLFPGERVARVAAGLFDGAPVRVRG